jgi:hypothetical protein
MYFHSPARGRSFLLLSFFFLLSLLSLFDSVGGINSNSNSKQRGGKEGGPST